MALTLTNNSPSSGYIAWSACNMQYNGVTYGIPAGNTNSVYVYWLASSPNAFQTGNSLPSLGASDCICFLNKNGVAVNALTATILEGDLISPGSILSNAIAANTITGGNIAASTITGSNIAAATISASNIVANTISAGLMAANAIGTTALAASAVTADKIAANTITASQIASATILGTNIAGNTISASNIAAGTITASSGVIHDIDASVIQSGVINASRVSIGSGTSFATGYDPSIAQSLAKSMANANMLNKDPTFVNGLNGTSVYNNTGDGTVTNTRIAAPADAPTTSGYVMQVQNTASTSSPGLGGFTFITGTRANAIFVTRIIAKIPTGYTINWASNATGTGGSSQWLTPQGGTGNYEEYIFIVTCGSSGTFSSTNFFYLTGSPAPTSAAPLTWYVAYATVFDTTAFDYTVENWKYSGTTQINGGQIYTSTITADKLSVTSLSAITANLGTITAGSIKGVDFTSHFDDTATNTYGSVKDMDLNNGSLTFNITQTVNPGGTYPTMTWKTDLDGYSLSFQGNNSLHNVYYGMGESGVYLDHAQSSYWGGFSIGANYTATTPYTNFVATEGAILYIGASSSYTAQGSPVTSDISGQAPIIIKNNKLTFQTYVNTQVVNDIDYVDFETKININSPSNLYQTVQVADATYRTLRFQSPTKEHISYTRDASAGKALEILREPINGFSSLQLLLMDTSGNLSINGGKRVIKDAATWYTPGWLNGYGPWGDTSYDTALVTKMDDNLVLLKGLIYIGTVNTAMFTIPAGSRPSKRKIFNVITGSGAGRVDVLPTGDVIYVAGAGAGSWVSIEGLTYTATQ